MAKNPTAKTPSAKTPNAKTTSAKTTSAKTPASKPAPRGAAPAPAAPQADAQQTDTQQTDTPATTQAQIRVRMFRQGLGDCFLISILRTGGAPFHLMIDCGVILGTPDAAKRLRSVVKDIIDETKGHIDVLAVTHEHYDHVAGFVLAADMFARPGDAPGDAYKLRVGEVWFAWTEDPDNQTANDLREERRKHVAALAAMTNHLAAMVDRSVALPKAEETTASLAGTLAFFGLDGTEANPVYGVAGGDQGGDAKVGQTAQAMINARNFAAAGKVSYRTPGSVLNLPGAPEIRLYVLGPPIDRASLMKTDSRSEVYAMALDGLASSIEKAIGRGPEGSNLDPSAPFDAAWSYSLNALSEDDDDDPLAEFFATRIFGPKTPSPETDVSWRRIDGNWTASAEQLALALDGATNNTSLVLAIEVVASGKVLLFPADAQVGNWLSWQDVKFDGTDMTAGKLLGRTVFYKVGHHGSHNATMKAKGLEMMPQEGLTAFVPVDHDMALKKRWGKMPLDGIMAQLAKQADGGGSVVRIDKGMSATHPAVTDGEPGGPFGTRWIDWTMPV